jgi:hypothetical protein
MLVFDDPYALFEQDRIDETASPDGRRSASLEKWLHCLWPTQCETKATTK